MQVGIVGGQEVGEFGIGNGGVADLYVLFPTPNGDQSQASLTLSVDGCSSHVESTVVRRKTVAQASIVANVGSEGSVDGGEGDGQNSSRGV